MTNKELRKELNLLLGTSFNWKRLSKLDLERLVKAIKGIHWMVRTFPKRNL